MKMASSRNTSASGTNTLSSTMVRGMEPASAALCQSGAKQNQSNQSVEVGSILAALIITSLAYLIRQYTLDFWLIFCYFHVVEQQQQKYRLLQNELSKLCLWTFTIYLDCLMLMQWFRFFRIFMNGNKLWLNQRANFRGKPLFQAAKRQLSNTVKRWKMRMCITVVYLSAVGCGVLVSIVWKNTLFVI